MPVVSISVVLRLRQTLGLRAETQSTDREDRPFYPITLVTTPRFGKLWKYSAGLLGLDVGRPDHLGPLLGVGDDELAEVGR